MAYKTGRKQCSSMLKKTVLICMNVILILIFTGCTSNVVELNLRADGSAQIGFIVAADKQTITAIENEAKNRPMVDTWAESLVERAKKQNEEILNGKKSKDNSGDKSIVNILDDSNYTLLIASIEEIVKQVRTMSEQAGFITEDYENKAAKGFLARKDFATYEDIKLHLESKEKEVGFSDFYNKLADGISIKRDDKKNLEISLNIDLKNGMEEMNKQLEKIAETFKVKSDLLENFKVEFRLRTFKPVDRHNATSSRDDGNTLVWDLRKTDKIEVNLTNLVNEMPQQKSGEGGESGESVAILLLPIIVILALGAYYVMKKKKQPIDFGEGFYKLKEGNKTEKEIKSKNDGQKWNL